MVVVFVAVVAASVVVAMVSNGRHRLSRCCYSFVVVVAPRTQQRRVPSACSPGRRPERDADDPSAM